MLGKNVRKFENFSWCLMVGHFKKRLCVKETFLYEVSGRKLVSTKSTEFSSPNIFDICFLM